ncbi:hypothetical protein N3K66_000132 [Trichothecium roseum]|uniref:Uncharacterized protein n=1 Tax=Trichothecium roseum TaxID=47278 RepID=A0ACC0VCV9_9HYPO|nr:hypothetical protein N3K66_000132 [Trichothecium roseum]
MANADRQTIMEANRSLRNIKNELEALLERGVIDEGIYDSIHSSLPQESPLSGPLRTTAGAAAAAASSANPTPARSPAATANPTSPPTQGFSNLNIDSNTASKTPSPAPPSYEQTPPPGLPARNAKPVVAHARALYRYDASDARDVSFEKDDKILVHEYMNQDWWMGQNTRTGREGIFPRNYVLVEQETKAPVPQYGYPAQPSYAQGPPQQKNPYDSSVPPVAIAQGGGGGPSGEEQKEGPSKLEKHGKKFGKKLGNAAIFGAGATIGGNIVNSIF